MNMKAGRSEIRKIKNSPPPLPLHQSARFVQLLVQHIPQQVDATGDSSAKNGLKICREWELDPCVLYTDDTEMQDVFTVRVWSGLDSFWAVQCWHKRFPSSTAVQAQLLCIQTAKAIKKTNVDNSTVIFCVCVWQTLLGCFCKLQVLQQTVESLRLLILQRVKDIFGRMQNVIPENRRKTLCKEA